jgi:hypothetical protein
MNVFVLDKDPVKAAQLHADKHVVKMILETAQMLCTAFDEAPYKKTHKNHPCSVWARESKSNYMWLVALGEALHDEYQYRYGENKTHKSLSVILWCKERVNEINFPSSGLTRFAQAMPEEYKCVDAVRAYKIYYLNDKKDLLNYTRREKPVWVTN